jgi:hypothetical protein
MQEAELAPQISTHSLTLGTPIMSIFDPDQFLQDEQEELSTERAVIPTGIHDAFIEDLAVKNGTSESGKDWARIEVKWAITEQAVLDEMEREKVTITQRIMLDIDEDTGKLATGKGKNYQLGQLRAAVGKKTGPLSALQGSQAKIEIKHRVYEGKLQEDVKSVTSA